MGIFLCSFESVYHKDIRLSLPLDTHCSCCVYCSWRNGRRQPFFILYSNTCPKMPRTGSIRANVNNSNVQSTPNSAKTVSYQKFEIEKNAKNKAYYFILSNGLFEAFAEFCKNYHSSSPHKDCFDCLLSNF
jgi:hypothetical protein